MKEEIISFLKELAIVLAVTFAVFMLVLLNARIPSGSMMDTVDSNSRVMAYRLAYKFGHDPERLDVVIFRFPDDPSTLYVKRIIGMPGDTVQGTDGEVYVNGEKLDEPYIKDKIDEDFGPYVVPEDSYFMMGDNRLDSWDSRFWDNKFVSRDAILGKALFEYFPRIKKID